MEYSEKMRNFFKHIKEHKESFGTKINPLEICHLVQDKFDPRQEHGPELLISHLLESLKTEWR